MILDTIRYVFGGIMALILLPLIIVFFFSKTDTYKYKVKGNQSLEMAIVVSMFLTQLLWCIGIVGALALWSGGI